LIYILDIASVIPPIHTITQQRQYPLDLSAVETASRQTKSAVRPTEETGAQTRIWYNT
jgi:hypothetical protein